MILETCQELHIFICVSLRAMGEKVDVVYIFNKLLAHIFF